MVADAARVPTPAGIRRLEASARNGTRHTQADDGAAGVNLGDEDGGEALALGSSK